MPRRTIRIPFPLDLRLTLGPLRRGRSDPTVRFAPEGFWRATRTPEGPATMLLAQSGGHVDVEAWGRGAEWALEVAADLIGGRDDPSGFAPEDPLLRELHRTHPGMRIGRSGAVVEALVPTILEQKVTGGEAKRSYARLMRALGEPAPGPDGLIVPPAPEVLAGTPSYAYHRFGIERRRAETIRRACDRASRLEEAAGMSPDDAARRLSAIPGVGPWSAAEVCRIAIGDADAVPVGDFHLPGMVGWALAGEERADDARMLELLEPYRGHRARVLRLLEVAGPSPPRRAPKRVIRSIEAI